MTTPENHQDTGARRHPKWLRWMGIAAVVLVTLELGLRLMFGNMAIGELTQFHPGDGRCVGLRANARVDYTGWLKKMSPVTQESNHMGYRGVPVEPHRSGRVYRIAVVGDSYVYGQGVTVEATLPFYLESVFGHAPVAATVEVLNFGVPGFNLEDIVEQYVYFASKWQPDLVLVVLSINDLGRPVCESHRRVAFATQNIPGFEHILKLRVVRMGVWVGLFVQAMMEIQWGEQHDVPGLRARFDAQVQRLSDATAGRRLVFAMLGDPLHQMRSGSALKRLWEQGYTFVDMRRVARRAPRLPREGHYSPPGNAQIADVLAARLMTVLPPAD